jgi:hypothetical protein
VKSLWTLLLTASLMMVVACGGGTSQNSWPLAGNWQFTMAGPADKSFVGGLNGGFLLQNQGAVNGAAVYSVTPPGAQYPCGSGSAPITGNISGQNVSLTASAGGQTFTLNGTLSADGSTMMGTYASTAGTWVNPADGLVEACGTAQNGVQWSARSVPPLNGAVQGNFHSNGNFVGGQDFPFTGVLNQGENIGVSNATVSGFLSFQGYSCLSSSHQTVYVNGEISGSSVVLNVISDSGLSIGQIGSSGIGSPSHPVVFAKSASSGNYTLQGTGGYAITGGSCPGGGGDLGNICMALGDAATDCMQPVSLTPATISFPMQLIGANLATSNASGTYVPPSQTITLTNTDPSGSALTGLTLQWFPSENYSPISGFSDFDGLPNFIEQDTCASPSWVSKGTYWLSPPFSLAPQQSCTITVSFSPQQSCPWVPSSTFGGIAPSKCPPFLGASVPIPPALAAKLQVTSPKSADNNTTFSTTITGVGISAVVPSTPELDFGAQALSESSPPQTLSFTNQGTFPVQILPAASTPCVNPVGVGLLNLPEPVQSGQVNGLQVVQGSAYLGRAQMPNGYNTAEYLCDLDLTSGAPNFRLSSDTCTGRLLFPVDSCTVDVTYTPQPYAANQGTGLDYFLELNTQQCTGSVQSYCEIDSGRFPVELKAAAPSSLRLSPAAGLDFGPQLRTIPSAPLTITLFNDPKDPSAGVVNINSSTMQGDYTEFDNCGVNLAPGASCTLTFVFTPMSSGFDPGTYTISFNAGLTQTIYLRGFGQ